MEDDSKPSVTESHLTADMKNLYNLQVSEVKELDSYDDVMFLITTNGMFVYVCVGNGMFV